MPYENLPDWARLSYLYVDAREASKKYIRERRNLIGIGTFAFISTITYPIVLGSTDQLLPSGNLTLDIGKYGLEFVLGLVATDSIRRLSKKRKEIRSIRSEALRKTEEFYDFDHEWRKNRF